MILLSLLRKNVAILQQCDCIHITSAYTIAPDVYPAITSDTESNDEGDTDNSLVIEWYQPSREAPAPVSPLMSESHPA
jgi:hypothetical protein